MAHFIEDMKCLRDEIEKSGAARNQLMRDLRHFTNSLRSDVTGIIDHFSASRVKTAKKMAADRKEFILNLKKNTDKFRKDFAKEVQEARQGWFSGHESSPERHTKKKT